MHVVPEFTCDGSEDLGAYRRSFKFEGFATGQGIPESHWPNELFMKVRKKAKSWYENTFRPTLPHFPTVGLADLGPPTPVLPLLCRCGSLDSAVCCDPPAERKWPGRPAAPPRATADSRTPGHTQQPRPDRKDALLVAKATHLGGSDERPRWIEAANATADVSDDAIHDLEAAATTELTAAGRQSLPVEERGLVGPADGDQLHGSCTSRPSGICVGRCCLPCQSDDFDVYACLPDVATGQPSLKLRLSGFQVLATAQGPLHITDRIHGSSRNQSDALLHLHPAGCGAWPSPIGPAGPHVGHDGSYRGQAGARGTGADPSLSGRHVSRVYVGVWIWTWATT